MSRLSQLAGAFLLLAGCSKSNAPTEQHPALVAALRNDFWNAPILIVAKNGDTTDLSKDNLVVGDVYSNKDTKGVPTLSQYPVNSVDVKDAADTGTQSKFSLTFTHPSGREITLNHNPDGKSELVDTKQTATLSPLASLNATWGIALTNAGVHYDLPCDAKTARGNFTCPPPKAAP